MENTGLGWVMVIVIGGVAGWLAEKFMKSNQGLFMNIALGIVGALIATFLLNTLGILVWGPIGYLISGFLGACLLIALARMLRRA